MSSLRGPLTRQQVSALMADRRTPPPQEPAPSDGAVSTETTGEAPVLDGDATAIIPGLAELALVWIPVA